MAHGCEFGKQEGIKVLRHDVKQQLLLGFKFCWSELITSNKPEKNPDEPCMLPKTK